MGASYAHTCNSCEYWVGTSGPWEFYRDVEGKRQPYGHPGPRSREAAERGISGLAGKLYCPDCDQVSDMIIIEFKQAARAGAQIWLGQCEPLAEYVDAGPLPCPHCGGRELVLSGEKEGEIGCPRCEGGVLESGMVWVS